MCVGCSHFTELIVPRADFPQGCPTLPWNKADWTQTRIWTWTGFLQRVCTNTLLLPQQLKGPGSKESSPGQALGLMTAFPITKLRVWTAPQPLLRKSRLPWVPWGPAETSVLPMSIADPTVPSSIHLHPMSPLLEDSPPHVFSGAVTLFHKTTVSGSHILKLRYNWPIKHTVLKCSAQLIFPHANPHQTTTQIKILDIFILP